MKKLMFLFLALLGLNLLVHAEAAPDFSLEKNQQELEVLIDLLNKPFTPKQILSQIGDVKVYKTVDKNYEKAFDIIVSSSNPSVTPWLKINISDYSPYFLYAFAIRRAKEKAQVGEVFFWLTAAKLRIGADSSLCQDEAVKDYFRILNNEYEPLALQSYINTAQAKAFDKNPTDTLKDAVEWDVAHPQKNSPDWFCKSGYAASSAETYPAEEWSKRRNDFKRSYSLPLYQ